MCRALTPDVLLSFSGEGTSYSVRCVGSRLQIPCKTHTQRFRKTSITDEIMKSWPLLTKTLDTCFLATNQVLVLGQNSNHNIFSLPNIYPTTVSCNESLGVCEFFNSICIQGHTCSPFFTVLTFHFHLPHFNSLINDPGAPYKSISHHIHACLEHEIKRMHTSYIENDRPKAQKDTMDKFPS